MCPESNSAVNIYFNSLLESKIPVLTAIFEYIWPFIFSGSVSADSTNPRSKIFGKMFNVSKNKTWICHTPATHYIALTMYSNSMALMVKNPPAMWETWVQSLHWEDHLEKSMVTHSSILAWKTPMDRGAWWATVHGVAKSDMTQWLSTHT